MKNMKKFILLSMIAIVATLLVSCNDDSETTIEIPTKESKIAKIHVIMHEGHLHGANFHANAFATETPWRRRQDMVFVKTEKGWQQEVSDYKEEVGEGKPFALAKAVNLDYEMTKKNPGGRHAFEFELFDKDGNRLNEEYTANAKQVQFFFTIDSYVSNETKEETEANNSDESFFTYVYRDTDPSDKMYTSKNDAVALLKGTLGEAGNIGMKGYFAFLKDQISYKLNVAIVEWTNGEKPESLKYNTLPEEADGTVVTKISLPINILIRNEYDDYEKMYEIISKYYGITAEELEDLEWGDYDPEAAEYWM